MEDDVCRFFPLNKIERFIRTGIFVTLDLNCFCGVQCLPAVFAEPGTPQFPPEVCTNPILTLNVDNFTCAGEVSGTITCNGNPVAGIPVILSSEGNVVVSFTPNPTVTNAQGIFTAIASVPADTDPTAVTIIAQAIVNGILVTDSEQITVKCPKEEGGPCDGCGILISTGPSVTTASVVTNGGQPTLIPGTINLLINECNNCGNSDNFNFQFSGSGIFQGLTLNFNQGRRTTIDCGATATPQTAVINGVIRVQGNNQFFNNGQVFNATITVTGPNPGTYTITATSGTDSFSATFIGTAGGTFKIENCNAG